MSLLLTKNDQALASEFLSLKSPQSVAQLLEVPHQHLIYYLYRTPPHLRYTEFLIAKRSGGLRKIDAPHRSLKILQQKLGQVLSAVYVPKNATQAFTKGRSIRTNAEPHSGMRHVLNLDLKDFFPSINFGRVRGLFMAKPYGLPPNVATLLAQVCCHDNMLPQGAPTSPIVSNMICARMDAAFQTFAKKYFCMYTRYADDITISKPRGHLPAEIAVVDANGEVILSDELLSIVTANGFIVKSSKTRYRSNKTRQMVTGLVVNRKPNVPRKFIRNLRAAIHSCDKLGVTNAQAVYAAIYDRRQRRTKTSPNILSTIRGRLAFLSMVKGAQDPTYRRLQAKFLKIDPTYMDQMKREAAKASQRDVFISHASEDKDIVARPLAEELTKRGFTVWYDEYELKIGDSLSGKINEGLAHSRFGIVILSPNFFLKQWPQWELGGLMSREVSGVKVILPIWHGIGHAELTKHHPMLADRKAGVTGGSTISQLVDQLCKVLKDPA